jgi:hypothetical protein
VRSNRSFDGVTSPPWKSEEITRQIRLAADQPVSAGHIHWMKPSPFVGIDERFAKHAYAEPALGPACPWLSTNKLAKPRISSALKTDCGCYAAPLPTSSRDFGRWARIGGN